MTQSDARLKILLLLVATARRPSAGLRFPSPLGSPARFPIRTRDALACPHASWRRRATNGGDGDGEGVEMTDGGESEEEGESYTWEELQADPELRKMEFDSSVGRKNMLLLPQRISRAVTALAWLFVVGGFVLNFLGYAWVRDPTGGIGIGTLDERDFQREVQMSERMEGGGGKPAASSDVADSAVTSRMEQRQDSLSV